MPKDMLVKLITTIESEYSEYILINSYGLAKVYNETDLRIHLVNFLRDNKYAPKLGKHVGENIDDIYQYTLEKLLQKCNEVIDYQLRIMKGKFL